MSRPRVVRAALLLLAGLSPGTTLLGQSAEAVDLKGSWAGTAKVTDESSGSICQYVGTTPSAVTLDLTTEESETRASVVFDLPSPGGIRCPALHKRYAARDVDISGASVTFTDDAGQEWKLGLRGDVLTGLFAGSSPAALPPARLSGEVTLRKAGGPGGGGGERKASVAGKTGSGSLLGGLGAVMGANLVGVGGVVVANRLLQDHNTTAVPKANCSHRVCRGVATPSDCAGNCLHNEALSGRDCGVIAGGVPLGGPCDPPGLSCQADLSCNNGVCQDRLGICPF